jgi:hypothetical protein
LYFFRNFVWEGTVPLPTEDFDATKMILTAQLSSNTIVKLSGAVRTTDFQITPQFKMDFLGLRSMQIHERVARHLLLQYKTYNNAVSAFITGGFSLPSLPFPI